MKYVISGYNGKVGKDLLCLLNNNKYIVYKYNEKEIVDADCFIHLAACSDSTSRDSNKIVNSNIYLLINIIDYCKTNNIKNLVFFSAMGICNNMNVENLSEKTNCLQPNGLYNISKLFGEEILKYSGLNVLVLRVPSVLTTSQNSGLLYRFVQKLKKNEDISITNGDKLFNSFVSVEDIFNFIIGYKFNNNYELVFLAKELKLTLFEIIEILKKYLNSQSHIFRSTQLSDFFNISIEKAQSYGYVPEDIEVTLKNWIKGR